MDTQLKHETAVETGKAAPALAALVYGTMTLNEWVLLATLVYIIMQAGYLGWKWHCQYTDRKNERKD